MRVSRTNLLVLLFVLIALAATPVFAQRTDGTIRGTVTDPSGAVVKDANVIVTNTGTGVEAKTKTSDAGTFNVPNLVIGTYTVKVEGAGFAPYSRNNVIVEAAKIVEVSAKLKVGSANETVEVVSGAELVQTESSQLTNTFHEKAVQELPTIGGAGISALNLAVFLPNTTTQLGGTSGTGGSIGGLRGRQNSFTVDGVTNSDPSVSTSNQPVIVDAIQEFSLSTNQYSAEYGNAAGGQFNIVTKSGTNAWHGSGWAYNNNRDFNAMDNIEHSLGLSQPNRFDYNRDGGSIGGPIIRNKLFIFGSYEYQTQGSPAAASTSVVPTAAGLATLQGLAVNSSVKSIFDQFPVAPTNNRGTTNVTVGATTTAIPLGDFNAVVPSFFTQHDYIINGDLNLNAHQIHTRYLKDRFRQPSNGATPQPQFAGQSANDYHKASVIDSWTISPNMVNEFRVGFARLIADSALSGIALAYPNVNINDIGSQIGPANNLPQNRTTNQYQLIENLSWQRNAHTFKFGGEYRWFTSPSVFLQNIRGSYTYANLDQLVNDRVPSAQQLQGVGDGSFVGNSKNFSGFAQDDWKLTNRLTLNLGLRYEFYGLPKSASNNAKNAISNLAGSPFIFRKPKDDFNNFAPRIGFAWDPTGSGKWAVRGGYGMAYDAVPYNFATNGAPPQQQAVLTALTACAGALATPPAWCPAFAAGNNGVVNFLAQGALPNNFIPPATVAFARGLTANIIADAVNPRTQSWSLGVQHELAKDTSIEVRYLGTIADELPIQVQLNTNTAFALGAQPLPTYFTASQVPGLPTASGGPGGTVAAGAPTRAQFLALSSSASAANRPFFANGFAGAVTTFVPQGTSHYHGGSIEFTRRLNKGLTFNANYTYSRAIDNSTNDLFTSRVNPRRPEDFANLKNEMSRSIFDVRQKFAATWTYDLPDFAKGNNVTRYFLNGWQYNGTVLMQGGQPVTLQSGIDANGNGDSAGDRALFNPAGTADIGSTTNFVCLNPGTGVTSITASTGACAGGNANIIGYVAANSAARYVAAREGTLTNIGRNTFTSPGLHVWNMSIFKNTSITERFRLQFRAEAFNVFNHRNFTLTSGSAFNTLGSNANALSTSYAVVTTPNFLNQKQFNGGSRFMQLGLKLIF
jgi:outer membrane receptor protein involved in Fe transport